MNRSSCLSSKTHKHKKWSESEVPKTRELRKRIDKFGSRRAIQLVKYTITSSNTHLSSSSSSSGSIEAPRFFLSHSSSSSSLNRKFPAITTANFISKIPKSTPISRLPHSEPFRFIKENCSSKPICPKLNRIKKSQSSKKPTSETPCSLDSNNTAPVIESLSASQDLLQLHEDELQCTPVAVSKIATCSALDCLVAVIGNHKNRIIDDDKSNTSSSNTRTPPIQASFSPEIQSTITTATTPACYGAGHLISGVTDRRKCRARGVLVALPGPTDNDMSSYNFNSNHVDCEEDYTTGLVNRSSVFMRPSPAEASLHWLLSPCHVDEKENSAPLNSLLVHKTTPSPSSPLSDLGFSFDLCNLSNNRSDASNSSSAKCQSNTNNMLISTQLPQFQVRMDSLRDYALVSSSPIATPYSRAVPLKEEAKHSYNIDGGNAPFSADTLGSGNVMQTPNSDSSLKRCVGLSLSSAKGHKRQRFHSELHSIAGDLRTASLSPKSHVAIWDTTSSSFQFDGLTTPSNSMDLSPFQKILDDKLLWTSNSTLKNGSQSQMRISWREGLVSRLFEMDEFDSCRCLSDEEEDLNINSSDPFRSCQCLEINVDVGNVPTLTTACGSSEFLDGESKEKLHSPVQCSYAEFSSTDGGGLARSEDSDWNLCCKNNLFEV